MSLQLPQIPDMERKQGWGFMLLQYLNSLHAALEEADKLNRKLRQNVQVLPPEQLIMRSPNGALWSIVVSNAGVVSGTAL